VSAEEGDRYRPLIAVVAYHLADDRVPRWPSGGYGVPAPYLDALRRAGTRTAIVSPGEPGDAAEVLEPYDGLLLVGGGDVHPRRWGAEPDGEHDYGIEPDRDDFEIDLLHEAVRAAVPTLCICRGMQVMNVAFGGTLHRHLPDLPDLLEHGVPLEDTQTIHEVTPRLRSRLSAVTKSGPIASASHHHQGVDRVGEDLEATGWTADGLVEAIELTAPADDEQAPWILGVQWHPEETAERDPAQQSLFDALGLLSRLRGTRARPGEREGRSRRYEIVDHDPSWSTIFQREAERIRSALRADRIAHLEHIGSTAVPGLAAKPIVDILLAVPAIAPRDDFVVALRDLGYRHVLDPWTDDHEFFSLDAKGSRSVNLHLVVAGSDWDARHLAFRDHLRADPEDADRYARLKRELAARHPRDVHTYTDEKGEFIKEIERRDGATTGD